MSDFGDRLKELFPTTCDDIYCGVEIGPGWEPLVVAAIKDIARVNSRARVAQIKEKFGGLRLYVDGNTDETGAVVAMCQVIRSAEWASLLICEQCGTTVNVTTRGSWQKTNCEECHRKAGR